MLPGIAEEILAAETNHFRFESFCRELCEVNEQVTLVPTSTTYDRGRDGRSIAPSRGSHLAVICTSLNRDIDEKIKTDLKRIAQTTTPDRLIYCSSQKLTDHRIDHLTAEIRGFLGSDCSVAVLAALQLANLAEHFPEVFEKHYSPEIRLVEATLLSFEEGETNAETTGLRLALITFGSEDAIVLRRTISRRAVMDVLRVLADANPADVAQKLSTDLGLARGLNPDYILSILIDMQKDRLVSESGGQWTLTEQGRAEAETVPPEAARDLLAGRTIIRRRLEELTGVILADQQFDTIWSTLLDFLCELFHSNGLLTISAVSGLLNPSTTKEVGPSDLEKLLRAGASRIRETISSSELGQEIEQAIIDMFMERSGATFEWLARVCERFVVFCALGLEATSAEEIRKVMRKTHIVLDSDIVLTLLCESETNHQSARELIGRFRRRGGRALLAAPILEEVAYHAWISEADFQETVCLLGKLRPDELRRYAANAFVRTFHSHARGIQDKKKWPIYISQFRGTTSGDYSKLFRMLQEDLAAKTLPATHDPLFQKEIFDYICRLTAEYKDVPLEQLSKKELDKASRDSVVLASVAANREAQFQTNTDMTIVLLSSSTRLRKADNKFRARLGSPQAVISLGAFSYLLAMIPDAQLGAGTLRRALFNFGETARLPDSERLAMRVIRATEDIDLPWARRKTLQVQLEDRIHSEARKRGVAVDVFRQEFESGQETARPAEIILSTVKSMAVSDRKSKELQEANRKIQSLEKQVDALEKRRGTLLPKRRKGRR